jgi:hypothetical protein
MWSDTENWKELEKLGDTPVARRRPNEEALNPLLTYTSETSTVTRRDRKQLKIFERKMYMTMKKKSGGY